MPNLAKSVYEIAENAASGVQISLRHKCELILGILRFEESPSDNQIKKLTDKDLGILHKELVYNEAMSQLP